MRKIYLFAILFGLSFTISAQKNGSIKGVAFDTLSRQPVPLATVTVVAKSDSSLVSFTMTDNAGRFELTGIPNGEYRLLISHVNYHNSILFFLITDEQKKRDLANVIMNDRLRVLEEVIVSNEAPPVTMVGDTIQYNAESFKVQPNASVEQLLKKLPGVKVEKDGTVKAQGEKVTRVLVDGKEFFGNDPKVATKNLPADAVDKVQVYDKQSDQAQLTGFEDGNYEKTINLKLKKDKKKGMFGKVMAGGGNKERYEGRFNVNSFKGARQFSAIGLANNTNAEGFSFMDILNFSGGLGGKNGGGNMTFELNADDAAAFGLGGNRSGINTAWGGGLNYNNIIGSNLDFQSNYFFNRFNPKIEKDISRENIIPGGANTFYDQRSVTDNLNNSHRFNLNTLYQIDSMHSLRIVPSFSYQDSRNHAQTSFQTRSANNMMMNEGQTENSSGNKGFNFKNDLTFRKKFNKKGRTFSIALQTTLNESKGDGRLNAVTNFFDPFGNMSNTDTLNQVSNNYATLKSYNVRAVYTEPILKRSLLELSVGKSSSSNLAELSTFDFNRQSGKFDALNDAQTNDFRNTYGYTNAGLRMRTQKKKYSYSMGLSWQQAELEGKIISGVKDSIISQSFTNLLPSANFKYNISRFKSFALTYRASTNQPSMSQLQPVPDLTNPLNIRQGNPDLKQEYSHNIQANLNLVSPYKNKNLFLFLTFQTTRNKIVNFDSLDLQTGVRYSTPVNVNGVYNLNSNISYSLPVRFLKGNIEIGNRSQLFKTKQFINKLENHIQTITLGPQVSVYSNPTEKLSLSMTANLDYNKTRYSLQPASNNTYISQEFSGSADWQLPKSFFLSTDFTYTINTQRSLGFNLQVPIWNASISKQFLRYNRGELKFTAYDLLNKNVGISRSSNQNYIEDSRVNTLRRFFLLSFTYSLSKTGLNSTGAGGMKIISR
jgi:hypothetical protein